MVRFEADELAKGIKRAQVKLRKAARIWQVVTGPVSAMVASAWRLGWKIVSATEAVTDAGRTVFFELDSPAVIKRLVADSTVSGSSNGSSMLLM